MISKKINRPDYPYNIIFNARSYYSIDSVANSYQTVSFYPLSTIGIKELSKTDNIIVYPNPVLQVLHIESYLYFEVGTEIEIINTLSQTILKLNYSNEIDVSTLSQGYYTLKIISPNKHQFHSKFLKE